MPDRNPLMPRPIDIANQEIRALKRTIMEMRSEMVLLKNQLKPVRDEYLKRMADEEEKEKEIVVVSKGWFY